MISPNVAPNLHVPSGYFGFEFWVARLLNFLLLWM